IWKSELRTSSERDISLTEAVRDVAAHDLVGAVGDADHAGEMPTGHEAHFVGQAHRTADLHAAVEHPEARLTGVCLDHVELFQRPLSAVEPPRAIHRHR